jgi:hypothetical protein
MELINDGKTFTGSTKAMKNFGKMEKLTERLNITTPHYRC